MSNIIVIDDDVDMLRTIERLLIKDHHTVFAYELTSNISSGKLKQADLILLDVMMPYEDGYSFCRRIRESVHCPIIFLTAKNNENDIVMGLGIGGDDYLLKPFKVGELRARVNAHLRRERRELDVQTLNISKFVLNLTSKELSYDGNDISLTKTEYLICELLLKNVGQVFSKRIIFERVFGFEKDSDESAIVEHVKNIRAKIRVFNEEPIETVWGMGYKWKK